MTASTKEALELKPCPFCGGPATLTGLPNGIVGGVACRNEDCFGPHTTALTKQDSIQQWNTRATPASLSCGETRERIARIIDPNAFCLNDGHRLRLQSSALAKADAILATGCVPDEAAIRADEREKCEKVADDMASNFAAGSFINPNVHVAKKVAQTIAAAIRAGRGEG